MIYLLACTCGAFYMRKTKRPFHKLIHDHVYYVPKLNTPIGHHIGLKHNYDTLAMILALDHVWENPRGGDLDRQVLQHETRWIHHLRTTMSPWLNDAISFVPFL